MDKANKEAKEAILKPRFAWILILPMIHDYNRVQLQIKRAESTFNLGYACIAYTISNQVFCVLMYFLFKQNSQYESWTIFIVKQCVSIATSFGQVFYNYKK